MSVFKTLFSNSPCLLRCQCTKFTHKRFPPFLRVHYRSIGLWGAKPNEYTKAVSDAEKIVGYPTSLISLRCLLSDELSNVALHMRRLVGTRHPLLKTARRFLLDGKNNLQMRGLVVLLISKTAGPGMGSDADHEQMISGIYPKQRSLAEITEMIHTAQLIHKGILNMDKLELADGPVEDLEFGNKMAILTGDFLLANASVGLAGLHAPKVVELIAQAIGDLMKAEFTKLRDHNGNPVLPIDTTMADWEEHTFLSSGSLIANSCHAAMELVGHSDEKKQFAFDFGKYLACAHRLHGDVEMILEQKENDDHLDITAAPVILDMIETKQNHPYSIDNGRNENQAKLLERIKNSRIMNEVKELCFHYGKKAEDSLVMIGPRSEARTALCNIVRAVTTF